MKKSERMETLVAEVTREGSGGWPPCYAAYFTLFNAGEYYEAHDVLEHLWLRCTDANYGFYKGLIQLAGAYVHLQKQFQRPDHPKDGRRQRPAVRLFRLALANLAPFAPRHLGLEVAEVCALAERDAAAIEASDFALNPWAPTRAPRLLLQA